MDPKEKASELLKLCEGQNGHLVELTKLVCGLILNERPSQEKEPDEKSLTA